MFADDLDTLEDGPVPGLRGTTYYRVHKAILSDIVNGTFAPGSRLKVAELCKRYGLSQMPIREALQLLQGEGFVVMSPNKGASVRPITRKFLTDIYDVRGALYAIVYRDVIASADAAFDHTLVDIQKRFDAAVEDNDARERPSDEQAPALDDRSTLFECRGEQAQSEIRRPYELPA